MIDGLTLDDLSTLPAVLDVTTAARVLGMGKSAAYELIRAGLWPTPILRLGRTIRIPTGPLLELLCLGPETATPDADK